jgi:hypothetical protein
MSCNERKIRDLIFDYVDGGLDKQSAELVSQHLADCSECRKLENEYQNTINDLKSAFRELATEHCSNSTLVEYVDNPNALTAQDKENIQLHLSVCSSCEAKVEMLRQVALEESVNRLHIMPGWLRDLKDSLDQVFTRKPIVAIASVAVIVVVLSVGYWLTTEPDYGPQIQFTTLTDVTWLNESIRTEQTLPSIQERNGSIDVGLSFRAFFDEESYLIQLQLPEGIVLDEKSIRKDDYNDPGIRLRIECLSLEPGEYQLILISRKLSDPDYMMQTAYPFFLAKD